MTVLNTVPVASVALNDHAPATGDTLTATATRSDADGDTVGLTYVWTVNGTTKRTTVTNLLTDTFDLSVAGNGDAGDVVVVTVTPNDGTANGAPVTDSATVASGTATPPIFSDDFTSGNLSAWTAFTRVTIDNATGSPAAPSARAQATAQSAFAYRDLTSPTSTACLSVNVNLASGNNVDLFRLRSAANGRSSRCSCRRPACCRSARTSPRRRSTPASRWAPVGTTWSSAERSGRPRRGTSTATACGS